MTTNYKSFKMKNSTKNTLKLLMVVFYCAFFISCEEEDTFENESFSSSEFRILKITTDDDVIEDGASLPAFGLSIEIVFNAPVDQSALSNGLSVSNGASFSGTYDETGSILTLSFDPLEYQSEYQITLSEGIYGTSGERLSGDFVLGFRTNPFEPPGVALSIGSNAIGEGEGATVTASLESSTTEEVTINLTFGGTAIIGEDYTTDSQTITINSGETSGSINLSVIDDDLVEGQEFFEISIVSVINGKDNGQVLRVNILDNDLALELELKGVLALEWSTSGTNGGKALHLKAVEDIIDLSNYAIGVANNGDGSDSIEYRFPAIAVSAGDDILLAREDATLTSYFGGCMGEFEHVIQTDEMNQNGNDAIELFSGTTVIETYGDINVDGTGQEWEYTGTWAYKLAGEWIYGGLSCAANSSSTQDSNCIYPICSSAIFFKGAMEIETDGGLRIRAYHFEALRNVSDASAYKVDIYNNGNTTIFRTVQLPAEPAVEGENILVVRDLDIDNVQPYFTSCTSRFTLYESPDVTSNGDDALVFLENDVPLDTLGEVGVDGTGLSWDYANSFGYRDIPGAVFMFPGAECTNTASSNDDASCFYPFCE